MEFKKHNVNNRVKVKLSEKGKEILLDRFKRVNLPAYTPKEDKDGYTAFQMWEFMNYFGEYMVLGGQMPFDSQILVEVSGGD